MIGQLAQALRGSGCGLLVRAYAMRHRTFALATYDGGGTERFLEDAFIDSGRNIAVAAGFLAPALRREARAAFLLCRALDAFEDLSPDPRSAHRGVQGVVDFVVRGVASPPATTALVARDATDATEISIAQRLPELRDELGKLDAEGRRRVHALVADMAMAMRDFLRDDRRAGAQGAAEYGGRVLGRAARYALQLTALRSHWPVDHEAIGRVAQAANLLRDAEKDGVRTGSARERDPNEIRLRALLEALEAAPAVPAALVALEGPTISGGRAAVTYLAATTAAFYVARLGLTPPDWLSKPLLAAALASVSRRAYAAFCVRLDGLILDLIVNANPGGGRAVPGGRRPCRMHTAVKCTDPKQVLETWLAMQHPDRKRALALRRVSRLAHAVIATAAVFPAQSIRSQRSSQQSSGAVMILDYLLACAVRDVAAFGNPVLQEFSDLIARLALRAASDGYDRDRDGDIAAFLATVSGRARGLADEELTDWVADQRAMARSLHELDEHGGFIERRRAARRLAAMIARGETRGAGE